MLGDIHRLTSGLLRGLIVDGALPADLDLGRFSVRVPGAGGPRAGPRGDILVDAALVYAREATVGPGRPTLVEALAEGLTASPGVAAVAVAGAGLLVVTLRPAPILAAVAAVLRAAGHAGHPVGTTAVRPGSWPPSWSGATVPGTPLRVARAEVLAEIRASLADVVGRDRSEAARLPPVGPVLVRDRRLRSPGGDASADPVAIPGDSFRFAVASRPSGAALELDLSVLGDRSRADPAFWVAYAHARIRAVLRRGAATLPGIDLSSSALAAADLSRLTDAGEAALARLVALHGAVLAAAAAAGAPQALAAHLRDVAEAIHSQWSRSKDQPQLRFVNEEQRDLTNARLALVTASALVLRSGLDILGIAAPDEMR